MMRNRRVARSAAASSGVSHMRTFSWLKATAAALSLCAGACDWTGDDGADEGVIDLKPIGDEVPAAERPMVEFNCLTDDPSMNQFIRQALTVCAEGDYDKFRQLFATSYPPPEYDSFKRIWQGVEGVFIRSVHGPYPGKENRPTYYVHAHVRLRKPDSKNRTKRDAVVAVFKELDEWRMGSAPPGVIEKILAASTQPAGTTRPPRLAATRPR